MTDPTSSFPLWFPLFFVGLWLLVGALLSEISQWPALFRRFPAGGRPTGTLLRGQVLGVGIVGESNVTGLILAPAGLYMYANPLFRFRRPPVLVPWHEVQHVSERRFLWMRSHTLSLGGGITTLRVKEEALRELRDFLSTPLPIHP